MGGARRSSLLNRPLHLLLATVLAALAAWTGLSGGTAHATPDPLHEEPLRVLFVGDSLTHGRNGDATFRYYLWRELADQQVPVTFVGPRTDLKRRPGTDTWYLRHNKGFERRHAAEGGSGFPQHLPEAAHLITTYEPDVVVLFLGFNDVKWRSPSTVAADAQEYVDTLWSVDPTIRVVIGEITPTSDPGLIRTGHLTASMETNRLIAYRLGLDPRVTIAHTRTGGLNALDPSYGPAWNPTVHTYDGTHPTVTGQTLLAQRFAEAFHTLGILPAAPRVYAELRWDPKPRPTVEVKPGRVKISWATERDRLYYARMKLVVRDAQGRKVLKSPYREATTKVLRLPPGRYQARLTAKRDAMVSKAGPRVRFRVTAGPAVVETP